MTITSTNPSPTLAELKKLKNSVIGNPLAKEALVEDDNAVRALIEVLNPSPSAGNAAAVAFARIEAAHIVASLAYGSDKTLGALLRHDTPRALLFAISNFTPEDPLPLRSAVARCLKILSGSLADIVGPPLYGIPYRERSSILPQAKDALGTLLSIPSLDHILPLLPVAAPKNFVLATSIAQLLATSIRSAEHRRIVVEWVPPESRKEWEDEPGSPATAKKNRGWEKPVAGPVVLAPNIAATGGWVVKALIDMLSAREVKAQEAALDALAALAKDYPDVGQAMTRQHQLDAPPPLSKVHTLIKSKNSDVQLSACLCAARVIRACGMSATYYLQPIDDACIRGAFSVISRVLRVTNESNANVIKCCYLLYNLITDDRKLSQLAYDRGSLERLSVILKEITPDEFTEGWDESEAESVSKLREASLVALATLSTFNTDVRRNLADNYQLLPLISVSLTCKYPGVRYAACHVVRMLARAVSLLRTNIVDSGLGLAVFDLFKRGVVLDAKSYDEPREDRRVLDAALKAICNIVVEFSPLRPIFLDQGLMPRLMKLIHSSESDECSHSLKLNSLWAVKNLLYKSTSETKRDIMTQFGWRTLYEFLHDSSEEIQEQAYHIIRNVSENEEGISLVYRELCPLSASGTAASPPSLFDAMASLLLEPASPHLIVLQATSALANLANGQPRETIAIVQHPRLLEALRTVIAERGSEIRRPALSCLLELIKERDGGRERRRVITASGVADTLRRVCEWAPVSLASGSTGRRMSHGSNPFINTGAGYLHQGDRPMTPGTSPSQTRGGVPRSVAVPLSPTSRFAEAQSSTTQNRYMPETLRVSRAPSWDHTAARLGRGGISYYAVGDSAGPGMPGSAPSGASPVAAASAGQANNNMPGPLLLDVATSPPADAMLAAAATSPLYVPAAVPVPGVGGIGSIGPHPTLHPAIDMDKEVWDKARQALDWLQHGEGYGV